MPDSYLNSRAGAIHEQIVALARAIPNLPSEFERGAARFTEVHDGQGWAISLFKLAVLVAFGFGAQWLFRKMTRRARRRLDELPLGTANDRLRVIAARFALAFGVVVAFALGSLGPFLALDWDPVRRETYLGYLIASVVIQMAVVIGNLLLAPDHERFRIIPTDRMAARFW